MKARAAPEPQGRWHAPCCAWPRMKETVKRAALVLVLLAGSTALAALLFRQAVAQVLFADEFEDY